MGAEKAENGRVRAWVLVRAAPVQGVSAKLRNLDKKKDDLVVIRADVVAEPSDFPYNIVVPVDAESDAVLQTVVNNIRGLQNVSDAVALKVLAHDPTPPHKASGFIHPREAPDEPEKHFRQDKSPGFNPWG